jgi:hypothetical protein
VPSFLERLAFASFAEYAGIGEGVHLRFADEGLAGGRLVHLAAFRGSVDADVSPDRSSVH